LEEIEATRSQLEYCRKMLMALDDQLPILRRELNRAILKESLAKGKKLGETSEPIAEKIKDHLVEAAKLYPEWAEIETERYTLRTRWGASRGRTPREVAYGWLRGEFGRLLYPYLELPPQPRTKPDK